MQTVGVQASTVSSFFPVVVVSVFPFFFFISWYVFILFPLLQNTYLQI